MGVVVGRGTTLVSEKPTLASLTARVATLSEELGALKRADEEVALMEPVDLREVPDCWPRAPEPPAGIWEELARAFRLIDALEDDDAVIRREMARQDGRLEELLNRLKIRAQVAEQMQDEANERIELLGHDHEAHAHTHREMNGTIRALSEAIRGLQGWKVPQEQEIRRLQQEVADWRQWRFQREKSLALWQGFVDERLAQFGQLRGLQRLWGRLRG